MVFPARLNLSWYQGSQRFQSLVGVYGFSRQNDFLSTGRNILFQSLVGVYGFSRVADMRSDIEGNQFQSLVGFMVFPADYHLVFGV